MLLNVNLVYFYLDQSGGLEVVSDLDLIKSAWRGAEAYHLLFLVHNYIFNGKEHDALVTLIKLKDYEDILPAEEIYCLLAITACIDNCFAICSTAFMKLESLEEVILWKHLKFICYSFRDISRYQRTRDKLMLIWLLVF